MRRSPSAVRRSIVPALLAAAVAAAGTPFASAAPACGGTALTTLESGTGPVRSLAAGGNPGGPLQIRIALASPDVSHQLYIDTDDERLTGMWSYQSHVSGSGWDLLVDPHGTLYTHAAGRPNAWQWSPLADPGFSRVASGSTIDICIPAGALGSAGRVRIAVQSGESWLPPAFVPGASYPAKAEPSAPAPRTPSRLAIHYGAEPWKVRDCTTVACAVEAYATFSHAVLGGGLWSPSHHGHRGTVDLVAGLRSRSTKTWGYVSLIGASDRALSVEELLDQARGWKAAGVTGVFLDEADLCDPAWGEACRRDAGGRPVPITRARQQQLVDGIHALGMPVFVNAFSPFDILAPAHGVPTPLRSGDVYLLENPTVAAGSRKTGLDLAVSNAKFAVAHRLRTSTGVAMAAIDTAAGRVADDADTRDASYSLSWDNASRAGLDSFGYTNAAYSAPAELASNLAILDPPSGSGTTSGPGSPSAPSGASPFAGFLSRFGSGAPPSGTTSTPPVSKWSSFSFLRPKGYLGSTTSTESSDVPGVLDQLFAGR